MFAQQLDCHFLITGVPPPTPQNLTAIALSPTVIHVSWDYLNLTNVHSFLITYEKGWYLKKIMYPSTFCEVTFLLDYEPEKSEPLDNTRRHYEITHLWPYSNYTIKITAYTKQSPSETSRVRVQTLEGSKLSICVCRFVYTV